MPSLVAKTVRGRKYWQIVESRRVNGKPRSFVLVHLGRPETLLARLQLAPGRGQRFRSVSHGAVAALWTQAQALGLGVLIDRHVPRDRRGRLPRRDGLTPGQSLVLITLARACRPLSKRAFAAWAQTTSLGRLAGVDPRRLTSQHFWDQMDAVPGAALAAIEEAIVRRVVQQERIAPDILFYDTTNFFTFIDSTNTRPTLPRRGHNKQKRHDLRQLGLALVVSRDGQLPLFHLLYEGDRPDVRLFPEVLTSVRTRVERLFGTSVPLTLVYDKGNVSRATQAQVEGLPLHYVSSLVPSQHLALLAEALPRLAPVTLPSGEGVEADRTRQRLWGQERTLVVLRSERLRRGQLRGLHQQLRKRLRTLSALTAALETSRGGRGTRRGLERQVDEILRGQHMRRLLQVGITQRPDGRWRLAAAVDAEEYRRLTQERFGLRIVMTDRDELSTAEIIMAYRGQSGAERAFRDMKDPEGCALRPQYHWTDQKLQVHAFCCVMAFLLLKLVERQARRAGLRARSLRTLLRRLAGIREVMVIEPGPRGRPRVRRQLEDLDPPAERLAACFGLLPATTLVTTASPG